MNSMQIQIIGSKRNKGAIHNGIVLRTYNSVDVIVSHCNCDCTSRDAPRARDPPAPAAAWPLLADSILLGTLSVTRLSCHGIFHWVISCPEPFWQVVIVLNELSAILLSAACSC